MILDNSQKVLDIELFTAAQALCLRGEDKMAPATRAVYDQIRKTIPPVEEDIIMYPEMAKCYSMIKNHEIINAAEQVCGGLL